MEIALYIGVGLVFFAIDIWLLIKKTGRRFFSRTYYTDSESFSWSYDDRAVFKTIDKDDINAVITFELRRERTFLEIQYWIVSFLIILIWPIWLIWLILLSLYLIANYILNKIGAFALGVVPFIGKHLTNEYMKENAEKHI